jgi:geranylgeranyl pyrophosphate synthase
VPNDERGHPAIRFELGQRTSLPDAFALSSRAGPLREEMPDLVISDGSSSSHKLMTAAAEHFFKQTGKGFRLNIILLAASAANGGAPASASQERLAQIVEMIHASSLMHDDVIDRADTRRGSPAVHKLWDVKTAVMGGDFLLARATRMLAQLGSNKVVELMALTIDEMVAGELMQATETADSLLDWDHYLHKTYRKTAALICLSCESAAVLGGHTPEVQRALHAYGRHLGLAYQIVDDMLDLTGSSDSLGKPAGHDMAEGHATAPALYALEEHPEMEPMIRNKFKGEGEVARALELTLQSQALQRTAELATSHAQRAADALGILPPSPARDGLLRLCADVLNRKA